MPAARDIMRSIDASLAQALAEPDWRDHTVVIAWPYYRELLALKGIEWTPSSNHHDATHDDRPLKTYRGHPLRLGLANIVEARTGTGGTSGWAIRDPHFLDNPPRRR